MRRPRNFQTDRCYHLVSRVAHRAFYLNEEVRTRFVERMRRWAEIEPSFPAHVPRLLSRDLLAVLADKPKRPADIRRELGVSSPNYSINSTSKKIRAEKHGHAIGTLENYSACVTFSCTACNQSETANEQTTK